jgi:hypothetical protein
MFYMFNDLDLFWILNKIVLDLCSNKRNDMNKEELIELRASFFAQYWSVKCMSFGGIIMYVGNVALGLRHPELKLQLKPISKLTDDDAIEYFDILWRETHKSKSRDFKIEYGKDWANSILSERFGLIPSNILHGIDFLRSKGYALPFMSYSVDDLVNMDWIKLI